jgi:PncC family amidohydrolase
MPQGDGGSVALTSIVTMSEKVLSCCLEHGWTLSVAESCTGGLVGGCLTAIPGSSASFLGGVIAYSNEVKTGLVGVSPELIHSQGAVSEKTALAMALGVVKATGADCGISVTGIAGPEGGTPEKPVGTVWFAVVCPTGKLTRSFHFPGSREDVRERSVQTALELFLEVLDEGD